MTNAPTTGEIVRAFRGAGVYGITTALELRIIDRLESQEREIERLNEELDEMQEAATVLHAANETHWTYIKELTARAESAEAERDAAIRDLFGICSRCKHDRCELQDEPCKSCMKDYPMKPQKNWKWRGPPQDGEEK